MTGLGGRTGAGQPGFVGRFAILLVALATFDLNGHAAVADEVADEIAEGSVFRRLDVTVVSPLSVPQSTRRKAVRERKTASSDGVSGRSLSYSDVPVNPRIDFGAIAQRHGWPGRLDQNSIRVIDRVDAQRVPHRLSEEFAHGDCGHVGWVIRNPEHLRYEIRCRFTRHYVPPQPPAEVPRVGVGDLLRYNAGHPRPITLAYAAALADFDGDGHADLVGGWNYAYEPGQPWDGLICYPRLPRAGRFAFGDLVRVRYIDPAKPGGFRHFSHTYASADLADFDRDGRTDLVYTRCGRDEATFFLNTGRAEASGLPIFEPAATVPVQGWEACRAVDFNRDGALDLVVDGTLVPNMNRKGWPFQPGPPVSLKVGRHPCFLDLDGDGRLDAISLEKLAEDRPDGCRVVWRKNQGEDPPHFTDPRPLDGIDAHRCNFVSVARDTLGTGLLVQHDMHQSVSFYTQCDTEKVPPRFRSVGRAESISAVLSLGDQAWPCLCDWDADGDLDLLVGGGYGWPRIVINGGSDRKPAYAEARLIHADGKPIRFLRNQVLGPPRHWHNMGYSYPLFVDWDADGLPDLICPNETNRIFWYRNVGTKGAPKFGARRQLHVDGFPESAACRRRSAERAVEAVYPREKEQPFFWRTGAAVADFNGDQLMDLVTLDGEHRQAALFVQLRGKDGTLHLTKERLLRLSDGRPIDDTLVARVSHWTESFRAVDWDRDGRMDLVYSCAGAHGGIQDGGSIFLLKNCGTPQHAEFTAPETMRCYGEPIRITNHGPHPWVGDCDGDGLPDLVACVEWSVYPFYRHAALMMAEPPKVHVEVMQTLGRKKRF